MDNQSLQRDEVEALSAIYGEDWIEEDPDNGVYSILLSNKDDDKTDKTIQLEFRLPIDYPLEAPPYYTLSAPWMSRNEKAKFTSTLDDIYCNHHGESIIYLWIEKAREFLLGTESCGNANVSREKEEDDELVNDVVNNCIKLSIDGSQANEKRRHSSGSPIALYHGHPIIDRRSAFQAHLANVFCIEDVNEAMALLMTNKKIAAATHNISAYRITGGPHGTCFQDCNDDGEAHAGSQLLHLLQILDVKNVLVVVSRWFGGILLGADRFKHIKNAARELIKDCGYLDKKCIDEDGNHAGKKKKSK